MWIESLARGEQCAPPHFQSEDANAIVRVIEKVHNELLLQRRRAELLDSFLNRLQEGERVEQLLDFIFDMFDEFIPYDRIGFSLLDEDDPNIAVAVYMRLRSGQPRLGPGYRTDIRQTSLEGVLRSGQPRILPDLAEHIRARPQSQSTQLLLEEGMRSSLTVPLSALGRAVGFLFFTSCVPGAYDSTHAALLLRLARRMGIALEKARVMESLEQRSRQVRMLANMVSHDLRAPLSVIRGYVEMLSDGTLGPLNQDQHDALERVMRASSQAATLVQDMLQLALADAHRLVLHKEPFSIERLVADQIESARLHIDQRQLKVSIESSSDLPPVVADPQLVGRVFSNLLNNAIRFAPTGSTLSIALTRRDGDVVVSVHGAGAGLSAEQQRDAFRSFPKNAGHEPGRGLPSVGLGLAIASEFVEAHGGRIWVESEQGQGATFSFTVPITSDQPRQNPASGLPSGTD
jgi:signal transduction histidine kinase